MQDPRDIENHMVLGPYPDEEEDIPDEEDYIWGADPNYDEWMKKMQEELKKELIAIAKVKI